ncbi:hypothetical protein [Streptomyces wuyuanensis]|uniref:hypothetical protein n=1 Tax=Streptomyces wuyuanensis TaxID=1196353 RepID=UPI0036BD2A37
MTPDLQQLVMDRLIELGTPGRPLSYRGAAARGRGFISHGTIGRIARGEHAGVLEEDTVIGLSLALGVPRALVEEAAGIQRERPLEPFVLPSRANRLTRRERAAVLGVVDAILAAADRTGACREVRPEYAAPSPAEENRAYGLVAYAPDGSGAISHDDAEAIRRYEEARAPSPDHVTGRTRRSSEPPP